ncbi:MAG: thiamine phosphate synthase [Bryobacterales bacterium]|nr:thiamine phosphate synthase [Bryobacterales bacterium]
MTLPRLYPIVDRDTLIRVQCSVQTAFEVLLDSGSRLVQFRVKGHIGRTEFAEFECAAELCARAEAALIVNDRADLAMLLRAGVHVGQDDLPPKDVRRLVGEKRLLGLSTHNEEQFRAGIAEPVDYLAFGPIFATTTKENPDPVVGLGMLRMLRGLTTKPLVAIGGITRANAASVLEAGADSVAVIGDLYPAVFTLGEFRKRVNEWQQLVR